MRLMGEIGQEHTSEFIEAADQSLTRLERFYYAEGHVLDPNVYVNLAAAGYSLTLRSVGRGVAAAQYQLRRLGGARHSRLLRTRRYLYCPNHFGTSIVSTTKVA